MCPPTPPIVGILTASSGYGSSCLSALLSLPSPPPIRALFRTEKRAAALRAAHAHTPNLDIVVGVDASDPSTLIPALRGCGTVFIVTPSSAGGDVDRDGQLVVQMMEAAVEAGVPHVIFGGSWSVNNVQHMGTLSRRFVPGEQRLRQLQGSHGLRWTCVRGGFFNSNYEAWLQGVRQGADEVGCVEFCVPAMDPGDVGRVAAVVAAAGGQGHEGRAYEVSGPRRVWMSEVVRVVGEVLGREVRFREVAVEEFCKGMPEIFRESLRYMVESGEEAMPVTRDVWEVTGREAVGFREWFEGRKMEYMTEAGE